MINMSEDNIIKMLTESVCTVKFNKIDGSLRKMRCTLHPDLIPLTKIVNETRERKKINDIIAVWDLDNQGWRSFKISTLLSVEKKK